MPSDKWPLPLPLFFVRGSFSAGNLWTRLHNIWLLLVLVVQSAFKSTKTFLLVLGFLMLGVFSTCYLSARKSGSKYNTKVKSLTNSIFFYYRHRTRVNYTIKLAVIKDYGAAIEGFWQKWAPEKSNSGGQTAIRTPKKNLKFFCSFRPALSAFYFLWILSLC